MVFFLFLLDKEIFEHDKQLGLFELRLKQRLKYLFFESFCTYVYTTTLLHDFYIHIINSVNPKRGSESIRIV